MNQTNETELVHLICVGTDHIWDLPFYQEAKVPITTSSGVAATPIAEWVIMTSLIASRKYNTLHEWQKQHAWDDVGGGKALFQSVTDNVGKRMGILGYGAIGRQVGRLAKAMGMDVVVFTALSRNTPESRRYQGYVVPGTGDVEGEVPSAWHSGDKQSLHHFLSQDLDQLLVSVSLTQKTKSMLGKEEFEILAKKNAFLINVSRGDILVQEDLIKALRHFENTGKGLRGAALDVTTPEPLEKDHPLWDAPNCIITPHMSCVTQDYGIRALEILEINLERLAKGRDLINVVDRERGYASNVNQKQ